MMPEIVAAMPPAAARYAKKGCGYDVVICASEEEK
jgi:hypothetical protein